MSTENAQVVLSGIKQGRPATTGEKFAWAFIASTIIYLFITQ